MATEVTLQPPDKDTYAREDAPTTNNSAATFLQVYNRSGYAGRTFIEFVISSIPAGQNIISAYLYLYYYLYQLTDPVGKTIWAYKLTRTDWVEAEATWNIYKTLSNWTTPGGDYVTSSPPGGSTTVPAAYGWMTWDVTDIVKDAHANGVAAELLLRYATEGLGSGYGTTVWYSSRYADDTTKRPKLVVTYAPKVGSKGYIIG